LVILLVHHIPIILIYANPRKTPIEYSIADIIQSHLWLFSEKQQDESISRTRELQDLHKKDCDTKDKIIDNLRQRVQESEAKSTSDKAEDVKSLVKQLKDQAHQSNVLQEKVSKLQDEATANMIQMKLKDNALEESAAMAKKLSATVEELQLSLKQKQVDLLSQTELVVVTKSKLQEREKTLEDKMLLLVRAEQLNVERLAVIEKEALKTKALQVWTENNNNIETVQPFLMIWSYSNPWPNISKKK
jgi:hypothetical protein